jgi:hypothetical protein
MPANTTPSFPELATIPKPFGRVRAAYADIGVERVHLQIPDLPDLDHLDFIVREVLPQLR